MQSGLDPEIQLDVSAWAVLYAAGVDSKSCVKFLAAHGRSTETRTVFSSIVQGGDRERYSSQLSEQEDESDFWSSPLVVELVRAGEDAGILDATLGKLNQYLKKRAENFGMPCHAHALWLWGTLLSCRVTVLRSCEILGDEFPGPLGRSFSDLSDQLREGSTIVDALTDVFPPVVLRLIQHGEEVGELNRTLYLAAELQEQIFLLDA